MKIWFDGESGGGEGQGDKGGGEQRGGEEGEGNDTDRKSSVYRHISEIEMINVPPFFAKHQQLIKCSSETYILAYKT